MSALSKVRGVNISKDDTRRMEDEARKMELKMDLLRKTLDGGDATRKPGSAGADSSRWKSGSAKKPLRSGYVKDVLEAKPPGRTSQSKRADSGTRSRDTVPEGNASGSASRIASGQTTPTQAQPDGNFTSMLAGHGAPVEPPNRAASNLQAALHRQSRESMEVEAFLAGLGLDRYVSLFLEHGFDCMEVVKEMQESHMRDIGMATGHVIKLRKRLAELTPAPAPPAAPAEAQSGSLSGTQKRVSFGSAEQAPERPPSGGTATAVGGGSLLNGHFDEDESKSSFQEAVRAWREGRSEGEGSPTKDEALATPAKMASGSFWTSVGGDEVNLERCSTPIVAATDVMMQSETQHDPAPGEDKICCYQCYKQFFAKYAVERASPLADQGMRRLCSESCANLWIASMQAKAAELQQRQEKLAKLEEMRRVMEYEPKAVGDAGAEPAVAA